MKPKKDPSVYPKGMDRAKVQAIIDHYDDQTDDEAVAEMEAGFADQEMESIQIPKALVPKVKALVSRYQKNLAVSP